MGKIFRLKKKTNQIAHAHQRIRGLEFALVEIRT